MCTLLTGTEATAFTSSVSLGGSDGLSIAEDAEGSDNADLTGAPASFCRLKCRYAAKENSKMSTPSHRKRTPHASETRVRHEPKRMLYRHHASVDDRRFKASPPHTNYALPEQMISVVEGGVLEENVASVRSVAQLRGCKGICTHPPEI